MIKGALKKVSDTVDNKLFGGHIKAHDTLASHIPSQITDALEYRSYDETKGLFYNENSVGVVFEFIPLLGVDEKIYNILNNLLSKSVPDGLNLQIICYSSPKIGTVLDAVSNKPNAPHDIYRTVFRHRMQHFEHGVWSTLSKGNIFKLRTHRVLISASIMHSDNSDAEEEIFEFCQLIESAIGQISPRHKKYNPTDLIRFCSDILNPTHNYRPCYQNYDPSEDINFQIMSPDTQYEIRKSGVHIKTVGNPNERRAPFTDYDYEEQRFCVRTLEAKNFPTHMAFGDMSRSIGDMFAGSTRHSAPVLLSLNVYYPPEGDAKASAQMKHIRATSNAESGVAKLDPTMSAKARDWEHAMRSIQDGHRFVRVNFQCTVIAPEDEINRSERDSRNLLTAIGFDMRRSDHIHYPAFLYALPMGAGTLNGKDLRKLRRSRTLPSVMVPGAAPIFGEFMGATSCALLMVGRLGQPFMFDNFSNVGQGNHNMLVVAPSGGGKSVQLNDLVFGTCANGGHAIIFDDGNSFKNHCLITGGNWYQFSLNDDFGLNVFDMVDYRRIRTDNEYRSMCVEMAKAVISQMTFVEEPLTKEERSIIEEAILHVMEHQKSEGTIDNVREYFVQMDDGPLMANTKSMAKRISSYCSDGVFGRFFNRPNTLDLSKHMTVFELSPLEQKPDLRSVILTCLLFMTDQKMVSNVRRRDLAVIDEAHKHIGNPNVCDVIQGWARRLRKYNAAVLLATQSATDFSISDDSKAIFENCSWKVTLQMDEAGVASAAQMMVFPDDYAKRCARSAYMSRGEFSEAVIIGGGSYSLGRLVLDPFSISIFTSTAEDVARINELQDRGRSLVEAIYEVSGVAPLDEPERLQQAAE